VHSHLLSTISASAALGLLSLDGLAAILIFWAAVRVLRAPREWFFFGFVSKVTWVIASVWFTWQLGDLVVPLGAVVALWHVRSLRRRPSGASPDDLPFATGAPVRGRDER
jgi:hypothetical protein